MKNIPTGSVITEEEYKQLEEEFISSDARLRITRLLRRSTQHPNTEVRIIHINRAINIARAVLGQPVYHLDSGADDYYEPVEYGWHFGELELALRRPSTAQLAEVLADLIQERFLDKKEVNSILQDENLSFRIKGDLDNGIYVSVTPAVELQDEPIEEPHPNIRRLLKRLDVLLESQDGPGVLHTSATIFETLAKDVVANPKVANETLGGFIEQYRKKSKLDSPILDYILKIYKQRNSEPLASHGHLSEPTITLLEATILRDFTRTVVKVERKFALVTEGLPPPQATSTSSKQPNPGTPASLEKPTSQPNDQQHQDTKTTPAQ